MALRYQVKALMWKNFQIRYSSMKNGLREFSFGLAFLLFCLLLRYVFDLIRVETYYSEAFSLNNEQNQEVSGKILMYAPKNAILDNIITAATAELGITIQGYDNANILDISLISTNNIYAGIEFDESLANLKDYPETLSFAIRVPEEKFWHTEKRYIVMNNSGPYGFDDQTPYKTVFLKVQNAVSMAFIKLASREITLPKIEMQHFPYPEYYYDGALLLLPQVGYMVLGISVYAALTTMLNIEMEKERQLKMVLRLMGLNKSIQWLAWFVETFVFYMIVWIVTCICLKYKFSDNETIQYTNWEILLLTFAIWSIQIICLVFMFSTFFQSSRMASVTFQLYLILCIFAPISFDKYFQEQNFCIGILCCFLGILSIYPALKLIAQYESLGGLQWKNILTPITPDDDITLAYILIGMIIFAFVYIVIGLYVEQVFPGKNDVALPWYFPFVSKVGSDFDDIEHVLRTQDYSGFEDTPNNKEMGVEIKNLCKNYGETEVIKNVSMHLYRDEITVLLGHNSVGKTTIINMLCGVIPPSSGTAFIMGQDIKKNTQKARESLGICPKTNILYDEMNVENNIKFYAKLKGLSGDALEMEIKRYLTILNLEEKPLTKSKDLSKSMMRKLSMCCAMCGGSKVIFYDEPSAGMDPVSRRQIWNFLIQEKRGRTILLTTPLIEEADVLGDRIAIMGEGKVKCWGTSFFLKKKYGSGYRLICSKNPDCNVSKLTYFVVEYIPDAYLDNDIETDVTYVLPYSAAVVFPIMLRNLENNMNTLRITGFGLNEATLEEVFMKTGAEESLHHQEKSDKHFEEILKGM